MKTERSYQQHLVISEIALAPGAEWSHQSRAWTFVYVASGLGYWLHPRGNRELDTGTALVLSEQSQGCFRASQLGGAVLQFFDIRPERLTGLVTLGDQHFMQNAAREERFAFRLFNPVDPICEKYRQLNQNHNGNNFPLRLRLLEVFIQTFGEELIKYKSAPAECDDAKARLTKLLEQIAASDLLEMSFADLADQMRCTPRHMSRTFHQVVGMSFREKQAELRMTRAQELLATTESKVIEVALESGYQSVSLFSLMFKRHFGVSPGKWRERFKPFKTYRAINRMRMLRA
jgi:AraC-like DNA-binding protein